MFSRSGQKRSTAPEAGFIYVNVIFKICTPMINTILDAFKRVCKYFAKFGRDIFGTIFAYVALRAVHFTFPTKEKKRKYINCCCCYIASNFWLRLLVPALFRHY